MPLEGTQLNTAFSSGAALDTLKHSDFSPMRKDHLHFPENMPATSKKLEMVALRKHALWTISNIVVNSSADAQCILYTDGLFNWVTNSLRDPV